MSKPASYKNVEGGYEGPPNAFERFAREWSDQNSLSQLLALKALGVQPEEFNYVNKQKEFLRDEYPPQNFIDETAGYLGRLSKKAVDPVGVGAAMLSSSPWGAFLINGLLSGLESYTSQSLSKESVMDDINLGDVAANAIGGGIGGRVGQALPGGANVNDIYGIFGEVLGRNLASEGITNFSEDAAASAFENKDRVLDLLKDY